MPTRGIEQATGASSIRPMSELTNTSQKPALAGRTGWLITDDKAGNRTLVRGVADTLGLTGELKTVAPTGFRKFLAPWGGVAGNERFGQPGSAFAPPWPAIAIATGRAAIPYVLALRKAAKATCYTVILQDPRCGANAADLIWVPTHDRLRGANVITTITSPHSFSPARVEALRAAMPADIAALPIPRVAVMLGGPNSAYRYPASDVARLAGALRSLAETGAGLMITPSRRSPPELIAAVDEATANARRILWRGDGDNPYPSFLAGADVLITTADSVNMTGEACATGRPVYVFRPQGHGRKFERFHAALEAHGATRPLPQVLSAIEHWTYPPLNSAAEIAREIERRWQRRVTMLPGLM